MLSVRKTFLLIFLAIATLFLFYRGSEVLAKEDESWAIYPPEKFSESLDKTFPKEGKPAELEAKSYAGMFVDTSRFYGWSCLIIGAPCSNDKTKQQGFIDRSALGITSKFIASTYSYPVASLGYYLADVGSRLGIPSSYAQGLGFGSLRPILNLWKGFRDASYVLLTAVLIVIGFMIMFRMRIDPRTVITVQAALPRIVVTLILITFSYAIAGFLIDMMYLVILLAISIVVKSNPNILPDVTSTQAWYLTGGLNALFSQTFGVIPPKGWDELKWWLFSAVAGAVAIKKISLVSKIVSFALSPLGGIGAFFVTGVLGPLLLGGLIGGAVVGRLHGSALGGAFNPFILVIIALGLLFIFIRLFFLLLNAYVQVLISVIFAPIQLLFDALPTSSGNFSRWLRNLIANLAVFPTVIVLLLVGRAISNSLEPVSGQAGGVSSPLWTPPLVPAWSKDAAQFIIGFGVVTLIPNLAGALKKMLQAKPTLPMGIGAPLSPFISGAQTALGVGQQFYYGKIGLQAVGGIIGKGGEHK